MPPWVQDQTAHWPDSPPLPLSQSPRNVLEKLLSGQTEHQSWGDGIPESDSRVSGGGAGGPDGQYFRLFSAFSSGQDQSSWPVGALRFSPASLPQEISVWVCDAHCSSSSSLKLKISVEVKLTHDVVSISCLQGELSWDLSILWNDHQHKSSWHCLLTQIQTLFSLWWGL